MSASARVQDGQAHVGRETLHGHGKAASDGERAPRLACELVTRAPPPPPPAVLARGLRLSCVLLRA
eukprot:scaffold146_cov374-Prasinococcus_capsulatus_cf.AAC.2